MKHDNEHALTIVICCYNGEQHLDACLRSLAEQTRSDFSVFVLDDGSQDASPEIAKRYCHARPGWSLRVHRKNAGLVARCNEAITTVTTPFFARLDADDLLAPYAVEKMYTEIGRIDDADFVLFQRWDCWGDDVRAIDVHEDLFEWIAAGTLFRTEAVRCVAGYSNEFWEEYDLYLKLLTQGKRYHVSAFSVYYYRRGQASMTRDHDAIRMGFASLERRWGRETLRHYGDVHKILSYYQQ